MILTTPPHPQGYFSMSADISGRHNLSGGGGVTGTWWVEARNATKDPVVHWTVPTTKT